MAPSGTAARDIPKATPRRDTLTAVAARSGGTVTRSQALPTPPNSISPALGPHGLKAQLQKARLDPVDSDLDLSNPPNDATTIGVGVGVGAAGAPDSAGPVTSALLAKHYLPDILLNQGPLAIRYIMGCLATSVPGFADVAPMKARRLVVAALEGRGEGMTEDGDVEFEKVGWGRWSARRRGQAPRFGGTPPPDGSGFYPSAALPITANGRRTDGTRLRPAASEDTDSVSYSHDGRVGVGVGVGGGVMETEADNMSLDGSGSASCSEAPDDDVAMNDDSEDLTDDEDWAAVGAAALRAASYPSNAAARSDGKDALQTLVAGGRPTPTTLGTVRSPPALNFNVDGSYHAASTQDVQEREAVEALLSLGSV